jgi:hypothetical protein
MGWVVLSHAIEKVVIGKGFVRIENEMAVVVERGWIFDPKVSIRNAMVAPIWNREMVGVTVKNGAQ